MRSIHKDSAHKEHRTSHQHTQACACAHVYVLARALSSAFNTQEHSLWSKSGSFRHALKDSSVVRVDEHEQIEVEKIEEDTVRVGCMLLLLPRLHHHLICAT